MIWLARKSFHTWFNVFVIEVTVEMSVWVGLWVCTHLTGAHDQHILRSIMMITFDIFLNIWDHET